MGKKGGVEEMETVYRSYGFKERKEGVISAHIQARECQKEEVGEKKEKLHGEGKKNKQKGIESIDILKWNWIVLKIN